MYLEDSKILRLITIFVRSCFNLEPDDSQRNSSPYCYSYMHLCRSYLWTFSVKVKVDTLYHKPQSINVRFTYHRQILWGRSCKGKSYSHLVFSLLIFSTFIIYNLKKLLYSALTLAKMTRNPPSPTWKLIIWIHFWWLRLMKSYLVSSCKGKQRLLYSFVKDNNQLKTNNDWIHLVTDITQIHEISFYWCISFGALTWVLNLMPRTGESKQLVCNTQCIG